jgi:Ca2+-binding RTX toxin-like protein
MHSEQLESRRMFAITVIQTYPGYYEIHGDGSANTIEVNVSQAGETFTLNGGTTYGGVSYISIFGYGGNDTIHVTGEGFGYIAAAITAGDGDDDVSLNFDGAIWAGQGRDTLDLRDSFRGEVYGEEGDDRICISGETIDAQIEGGNGNDLIDASGNNYGVVIRGGAGNDTIYGSAYDDQLYGEAGDDVIVGNGGNDAIYG